MRIAEMNWMQVEEYLKHDNRAVVPLGSTEQHGFLSLGTDSILAERVAVEAAEPLGVPVFPVLAYGITPYFRKFSGSVSIRMENYLRVVRDMLDMLAEQGFKRILLVNGHGGNTPAQTLALEWGAETPGVAYRFHNWWNAPKTWAKVMEIDPVASHASWMENFPWTRLPGVTLPTNQKPMADVAAMRMLGPAELKRQLVDGNYGGRYQRADDEMLAIWNVAVAETRELLTGW
jgi:creatinine amidohydrolase